jgi:dTDP-4-amino-4,6-dideoxygalactose transaminase
MHAAHYNKFLTDSSILLPKVMPYARHVYHIYAVRVQQRDTFRQTLQNLGIQTGIHYPIPVHLQPAHADLDYSLESFPCSEQAAREVVSLPMYAELNEEQIRCISSAISGR